MLMGSSNIKTMNVINLGRAISALQWKKAIQGNGNQKPAIGCKRNSFLLRCIALSGKGFQPESGRDG